MSADSVSSGANGPHGGLAVSELQQARRNLAAQKRVLELLATGRPLEDVLTALVDIIEHECPGAFGSVLLLDEDGQHLRHAAAPRLPEAYNRAIDGLRIDRVGSCGTAAYRGERVVVEDIANDPLWADYRELALEHDLLACWSQPIVSAKRKVLGTFAMYYRERRGPSAPDLEYIELAAHLAGIAIERERSGQVRRSRELRLLTQASVLVELAKSDHLGRADFEGFARLATETAARTLDVERVGVWFFSDDRAMLRCRDQYEMARHRHSQGVELESERYPRYFAALERGRTVAAHEARTDPDTSEFAMSYLEPLGITSMLDAPLRKGGALVGVVCHEHVGPPRVWSLEEQEFAASVADIVSLALESSERRRAEQNFRVAQEELLRQQWQARKQVESELERVESELVRKTRLAAIGQVAASIAHELRQPLTAIRNARYYLSARAEGQDPKCLEHLEIIEQELHSADGIIDNLLETTRAQPPRTQSVDLASAVRDAFGRVQEARGIDLDLRLRPEPFSVQADPEQLRQLLVNVLTNAAQAMQGRGVVHVDGTIEDGARVIRVRDEGPGIAAGDRGRVFEPLFTTRARGTGLGLTICGQIAERHGWTLELDDTVENGAAFRIEMP